MPKIEHLKIKIEKLDNLCELGFEEDWEESLEGNLYLYGWSCYKANEYLQVNTNGILWTCDNDLPNNIIKMLKENDFLENKKDDD